MDMIVTDCPSYRPLTGKCSCTKHNKWYKANKKCSDVGSCTIKYLLGELNRYREQEHSLDRSPSHMTDINDWLTTQSSDTQEAPMPPRINGQHFANEDDLFEIES